MNKCWMMHHQRSPAECISSKIQMQRCRGGILTTPPRLCVAFDSQAGSNSRVFLSLNLEFGLWNMIVFQVCLHLAETISTAASFSLCWRVCAAARHYRLSSMPWLLLKNKVSSALATVTLPPVPARVRGNCWFVATVGLDCVWRARKTWLKTVSSF